MLPKAVFCPIEKHIFSRKTSAQYNLGYLSKFAQRDKNLNGRKLPNLVTPTIFFTKMKFSLKEINNRNPGANPTTYEFTATTPAL
jgi:hypothetical protein